MKEHRLPTGLKLNVLRQLFNSIPPHLARDTGVDEQARSVSVWSNVVALGYAQDAMNASGTAEFKDLLSLGIGGYSDGSSWSVKSTAESRVRAPEDLIVAGVIVPPRGWGEGQGTGGEADVCVRRGHTAPVLVWLPALPGWTRGVGPFVGSAQGLRWLGWLQEDRRAHRRVCTASPWRS